MLTKLHGMGTLQWMQIRCLVRDFQHTPSSRTTTPPLAFFRKTALPVLQCAGLIFRVNVIEITRVGINRSRFSKPVPPRTDCHKCFPFRERLRAQCPSPTPATGVLSNTPTMLRVQRYTNVRAASQPSDPRIARRAAFRSRFDSRHHVDASTAWSYDLIRRSAPNLSGQTPEALNASPLDFSRLASTELVKQSTSTRPQSTSAAAMRMNATRCHGFPIFQHRGVASFFFRNPVFGNVVLVTSSPRWYLLLKIAVPP